MSPNRLASRLKARRSSQPQPASLTQDGPPALPSGVVFSVEGPTIGGQEQAPAAPAMMPMSLPLPPADLGPLELRQAAAQGDARAQYAIALRYAQGQGTPQNLTDAVRWFERAAAAGFAPAQYRLAVLYERGQGVAKDLGRARSWYQAAAEKGNVKSMHNLAVSASSAKDGGADYALAAKWYGEAAAYGLADSQFNLGILEEHGLGMPKNLANAYKWFALAAKNGDEEAAKRRDLVKREIDAASLAAAEQAIAAWTPKQAAGEANEIDEPQDWADGCGHPQYRARQPGAGAAQQARLRRRRARRADGRQDPRRDQELRAPQWPGGDRQGHHSAGRQARARYGLILHKPEKFRHARPHAGHPRLVPHPLPHRMAGTSPAMTARMFVR